MQIIPLPDTGLNLILDNLTFEIVRKTPYMLKFGNNGSWGPYVGVDAGMRVYVAQHMYTEQAEKLGLNHTDLCWMENSNWLIFGSHQTVTFDFFKPLLPDWFDAVLAQSVLEWHGRKDKSPLPPGRPGRYEATYSVETCARDALFTATGEPISGIKFTPDVELLINNGEGYFDGHALQIWSDGVVTRKSTYKCGQPKFQPGEDILDLLKYAMRQKYWCEADRWMGLLNLKVISKQKIREREFGGPGNYNGFALYRWDTTIGPLWLAESSWGYLGEDGDAGENTKIFDNEAGATAYFQNEVNGFEEQERKTAEYYQKQEEEDGYL